MVWGFLKHMSDPHNEVVWKERENGGLDRTHVLEFERTVGEGLECPFADSSFQRVEGGLVRVRCLVPGLVFRWLRRTWGRFTAYFELWHGCAEVSCCRKAACADDWRHE